VSPNLCLPPEHNAWSPIAKRILQDPYLTYDVSGSTVVVAIRADLVVSRQALAASPALRAALEEVADAVGGLADEGPPTDANPRRFNADGSEREAAEFADVPTPSQGPAGDVGLWRLRDPQTHNAIDEARRLQQIAAGWRPGQPWPPALDKAPAVSPNHVAMLSPSSAGCPAGPPMAAADSGDFVLPLAPEPTATVTVLDSGYVPLNPNLNERVTLLDGAWFDGSTGTWVSDTTDAEYLAAADASGTIDGITGHGTFIAGLIANVCPQVELTVVGLRDQEVPISGMSQFQQHGLYASEVAIARAMLQYGPGADVIQCGFAIPTLDDYPSLPFRRVLEQFDEDRVDTVVVCPAGNESSTHRYWPASLKDATGIAVIGVAATDRRDLSRAEFSNWGNWCECCTRGAYVYSTFVDFTGRVEGEGPDLERFTGWARWDGTSFAAPQVSGLIARAKLYSPEISSASAYAELKDAALAADELVWDQGVGLPRLVA